MGFSRQEYCRGLPFPTRGDLFDLVIKPVSPASAANSLVLSLLGSSLCVIKCLQTGGSDGKESACNAGNPGLIPRSGRSSGGRQGNLLQYSCLENSMDLRSLVGYSP